MLAYLQSFLPACMASFLLLPLVEMISGSNGQSLVKLRHSTDSTPTNVFRAWSKSNTYDSYIIHISQTLLEGFSFRGSVCAFDGCAFAGRFAAFFQISQKTECCLVTLRLLIDQVDPCVVAFILHFVSSPKRLEKTAVAIANSPNLYFLQIRTRTNRLTKWVAVPKKLRCV